MRGILLGLGLVVSLFFIALGISLVTQNGELINISLFSWESPAYPKWIVMVGAFLTGFLVAFLYFIFNVISLETQNVRLRRSLSQSQRLLNKTREDTLSEGSELSEDSTELSSQLDIAGGSRSGHE